MKNNSISISLSKAFRLFIPLVILYAIFLMLEGLDTPFTSIFSYFVDALKVLLAPTLSVLFGYYLDGKKSFIPNAIVGSLAGFYGTTFLGGLLVALSFHILYKVIKSRLKIGLIPRIILILIIQFIVFYFAIIPFILYVLDNLDILLNQLEQQGIMFLVVVLAGLTAVDLGGPLNKAAFSFTITAFLEGNYHVTGPVLLTTGIPVLGMGVIHLYRATVDKDTSQLMALKTIVLGIVGLTEGALPYAAKEPGPVLISGVIGSMTSAFVAVMLGVSNRLILSSVLGVFGTPDPIWLLLSIDAGIIAFIISYSIVIYIQRKKESY